MIIEKIEKTSLDSLRQRLMTMLEERKPVVLKGLAAECGVSELCVAHALPNEMRAFAPKEAFDAVWDGLTTWDSATFLVQHGGSVVEIKGRIPKGKHAGGYFNLVGGAPLGGHICSERVASICFLSMPFMGLESHSVQFLDMQGAVLFAVYVGREKRELIPSARESFFQMREQFGRESLL